MLSSSKIVMVAFLLYTLTILLPSLFGEVIKISPEYSQLTALACMIFVAGMACGSLVAPLRSEAQAGNQPERVLRPALVFMSCVLALIAVYVFVWGPASPIIEAFEGADSQAVALAREDAIKLNPNLVFVRIYTWGRDFFAPVVFTLALAFLNAKPRPARKGIAFFGFVLAIVVGVWSGQKGTIVYYLIGTFIVLSAHARALTLNFLKIFPLALVFIVALFAVTQPDLFTLQEREGEAATSLAAGIVQRIIISPLELAGLYLYVADELHVVRPSEVLPIIGHREPELGSVEHRMSDEYWGDNATTTGHANGPAFVYAYVLGRLLGCFVGGFAVVVLLTVLVAIVRRWATPAAALVFEAYIAYLLLDLLSSNFMGYLINATLAAGFILLTVRLFLPAFYRRRFAVNALPAARSPR